MYRGEFDPQTEAAPGWADGAASDRIKFEVVCALQLYEITLNHALRRTLVQRA